MAAITGYRLIDRDFQLFFLEAPTRSNAFESLLPLLAQLNVTVRAGPSVLFLGRLFAESPLALIEIALYRPLYTLSSKYSPQLVYLQPLLRLFTIDPSGIPQVRPSPTDLRAMQKAGQFLCYQELKDIQTYYSGPSHKKLSAS